MTATLQLFLAFGFGRDALIADLVLSAVATGATLVVLSRRRQRQGVRAVPAVVAEAEAVVAGAPEHQRV